MNDHSAEATFFRRLAAFAVDAGIVVALSVVLMSLWVIRAVGRIPVSELDWDRAFVEIESLSLLQYVPLLAYVMWSWTPIAGRRSVGKRALGLRVIRE